MLKGRLMNREQREATLATAHRAVSFGAVTMDWQGESKRERVRVSLGLKRGPQPLANRCQSTGIMKVDPMRCSVKLRDSSTPGMYVS